MELFILLFADDVALIATTPSGLQHQLNLLEICCQQLHLKGNMEKTNLFIYLFIFFLRKGGFLAKHERRFYEGKQLEVVNKYCYLGFMFTTKMGFNIGIEHLVLKG
jgi:hypothetical protein